MSISQTIWYPIYLGYCTGLLEKYGHKVRFMDAVADRLSMDSVVREADRFSPELAVVNYSLLSSGIDLKTAEEIKDATGCYTVLVGPCCSIRPKETLKKSEKVDGLIRREFDYPVLDLANELPEKRVKNLSWRSGDKIVHNPERAPVSSEQLNEFPFVTDVYRRHLNIRNYYQAPQLHPFVDLFTGRSCSWGKCAFCLWSHTINKGVPYRTRSMDGVIKELWFVKRQMSFVREVFIQDDTLPAWRCRELSSAIIESGLDIVWSCYARADETMDYETLKLMRESGCRNLHVGYESADPRILKNVNKGITRKTMKEFTEAANRAGLMIHADFIFGLPGETVDTIKSTIEYAKKLDVDSYQFIVPKAYPGTPYHGWLESKGYLKDGQVDYPHLSHEEICEWSRIAMRECFFSWRYFSRVASKSPREIARVISAGLRVLPRIFR